MHKHAHSDITKWTFKIQIPLKLHEMENKVNYIQVINFIKLFHTRRGK